MDDINYGTSPVEGLMGVLKALMAIEKTMNTLSNKHQLAGAGEITAYTKKMRDLIIGGELANEGLEITESGKLKYKQVEFNPADKPKHIFPFYMAGQLKEAVKNIPDDRIMVCQVVAENGEAWNLCGEICPQVPGGNIGVITFKHAQLKSLPKWEDDKFFEDEEGV